MVDSNQGNESGGDTNGDSNLSLTDISERVVEIDAKIPSPKQRAEKLFAFIKANMPEQPSVWDTVCFAAEYIGSQVGVLPFLEDDAKRLLTLIYTFHYAYPATVDTSYSNDESNSSASETEANASDVGHNSGNESHG